MAADKRPFQRDSALILVASVAAHALFYRLGGSFTHAYLFCHWQLLEGGLLRSRLAESIFYLHAQPPLFNAALGSLLKLAPLSYGAVLSLIYLFIGQAILLLTYLLQRKLGVGRSLATLLTVLLAWNPDFLLYEHYLFYSAPEALALLLLSFTLVRAVERPSTGRFALFFTLFALLTGFRALYHLSFMALTAALLFLVLRDGRVLLGSMAPIFFVTALYAKNFALFGVFSASSWLGMNVAHHALTFAPPPLKRELAEEGRQKLLLAKEPFLPLSEYEGFITEKAPPREAPALTNRERALPDACPPEARPNFNHYSYLSLSRRYFEEALDLYVRHPSILVDRTIRGWSLYFLPSSRYLLLEENYRKLGWWNEAWERFIYLRIPAPGLAAFDPYPPAIYPGILLGVPLVLYLAARAALRQGTRRSTAERVVLAWMAGVTIYAASLGNLLEVPENNRFRFPSTPMIVVLVGWALSRSRVIDPEGETYARRS